ncbi:MAG: aminomethyl-transferring glycine dehydrogenase subunit GcvPA [Thaumarchaeota archaeon]|nr:aminomethyl-transferring glycine dehydrogenase subunit GcvPA [Nitrososphaerota archaeon]
MAVHKFLPNSDEEITRTMLEKLGLRNLDDLFADIPESVRLRRPMNIPDALSEIELEKRVSEKLSRNKAAPEFLNFIGGGNWNHHVPSVIDEILSRSEFYTAYTPYQPEISQGMLQALFEYQSQMCDLTSMDVANSSMYDWSSGLGEAGRMAQRVTGRTKIVASSAASPERLGVLETYCEPAGISVTRTKFNSAGETDLDFIYSNLDDSTAAVYIENPNFLGVIERSAEDIARNCHKHGALLIVGVNPMSLGIMRSPGSYGADIVVGDGQPLGLYPNFGGPLMGIFATRSEPTLLRQMPGRLIGMTESKIGSERGYTMVLQTREQHIRREHATSNICTNESLFALAVSIYLSIMGPAGMKEIGERIVANSRYALKRLVEEGLSAPHFGGKFFGDVSLKSKPNSIDLSKSLVSYGILGGLPLGRFYSELKYISLFSFNEVHSVDDIERLISALKSVDSKIA